MSFGISERMRSHKATHLVSSTLKAILNDELYVVTHGEWRGAVQARHDQIMAATPTEVNMDLIRSLMPKDK